jgi:hypothetical protein
MAVYNLEKKRWLKSIGSADDPLDPNWVDNAPQELTVVHYSKDPVGIGTGDLLVYYAAVHQKLVGIVEVFQKAEFDARLKRWQHLTPVRARLIIKDMDRAPSIDVMNVDGKRPFRKTVQQLDYAVLTDDEYQRALDALEAVFDESKGDIRSPRFNSHE